MMYITPQLWINKLNMSKPNMLLCHGLIAYTEYYDWEVIMTLPIESNVKGLSGYVSPSHVYHPIQNKVGSVSSLMHVMY